MKTLLRDCKRVEKAALQSAQRIERNLNRAFKVNLKAMDKQFNKFFKGIWKKD